MVLHRVDSFGLRSTMIRLLIAGAAVVGMSACASRPAQPVGGTIPHVDPTRVDPSSELATTVGTVEWRFSDPQPEWTHTQSRPLAAVVGLERLKDALRVTLSDGSATAGEIPRNRRLSGGIYIDLPDWRREDWTEIVVRARSTSSVTSMRVGLNHPELAPPPGGLSPLALFTTTFQASPSPFGPFTPGGVTPVVRDGLVHTYRIHLDWGSQRTGPWRRVGLFFVAPVRVPAPASASIDILSVRVVRAAPDSAHERIIETTLEPWQLKADFALLRTALEEAHPALYRYTSKRDMGAAFARAEAKLTRPMTILQFRTVLGPVLTAIKDGHTMFTSYQGDEIDTVVGAAKRFPLALTFDSEERAFVLVNQGLDERVRPGMQVLDINGQSLPDLLRQILPNLTADADIRSWKLYQLSMWAGDIRSRSFFQVGKNGRAGFGEAYFLYVADTPSFRTTLRDPHSQETVVVDLAGVTDVEAVGNAERNPVNRDVLNGLRALRIGIGSGGQPSIRYLDGEDTAVLANAWSANFPEILEKTFSELKSKGTKHLIIDVRGNTGGFDQYPVLLFTYLSPKAFRTIEGNHVNTFQPSFIPYTGLPIADLATDTYLGPASGIWKPDPRGGWLMTEKYPTIGTRDPAANHFDGPVYVLIDGGCFSATPSFTALTDYYKRATFIGEETGGTGSGGAGTDTGPTLPYSHLHAQFSQESYFSVVDRPNPRRGTLPQHRVIQTIDDIARGRDTALEFTRELIRIRRDR